MKRLIGLSSTLKYTLSGILIGLIFPIFGTILQVFIDGSSLNLEATLLAQRGHPLLWIIDTVPLFLGLSFGLRLARRPSEALECPPGGNDYSAHHGTGSDQPGASTRSG